MTNEFNFDLDQFEASNYGAMPKGKYQAQVDEAKVEITKAGGQMIAVRFNITGETYNGAKVFRRFNVAHTNPEVVKIGVGQIKSLIQASGANVARFTSPEQLLGLECMINVGVEEYDGEEQNVVKGFSKIKMDGMPQMTQQPQQAQQTHAQPGAAQPQQAAQGHPPF